MGAVVMDKVDKPIKFRCEVFKMNYVVYYGWDREKAFKAVKSKVKGDLDFGPFEDPGCYGCCFLIPSETDDPYVYIWTREKLPSVLAHEALHAVFYTLGGRMEHCGDNEETYTYLMEFIMREVLG
jgi:hypothetical protein